MALLCYAIRAGVAASIKAPTDRCGFTNPELKLKLAMTPTEDQQPLVDACGEHKLNKPVFHYPEVLTTAGKCCKRHAASGVLFASS